MQRTSTVSIFGDTISVHYDGTMWISPANGQQHPTAYEAMDTELRLYYSSCGDDPDSTEIADEITSLLEIMD